MAERTRSGGGRGTSRRAGTTSKAGAGRAATSQGRTGRTSATRARGGTGRASATAAATDAAARQASDVTRPERLVVEHPPPEPDYPRWRVEPGTPTRLADIDPDESEGYQRKKDVTDELKRHRDRISDLQGRLYGEHRRSLLIVLQAMDTGGKDGTIKGVFAGVNPQGCQVWSFKAPSNEEADHDFLWRYHHKVPAKGMIHIFNRSHYEDVLIVRVKDLVPESVWRPRYEAINQFEYALTMAGVTVLKFFLHISKDEQKRRLESRLQDPDKRWKFSSSDLKERAWWEDYQAAFEDAVNQCSTPYAPWYVVPANKKWYRNLVVARTIADTLEALNPRYPAAEKGLDKVEVPD
jgi:PPK2 family polyphosphate:nucleotide phosphotransferase